MSKRSKGEVAETRETLLDAAECLFLERGVSHTTLEQIARRAGMTRGAIYWHFSNKSDLFGAMLCRVRLPLDQLIADLEDQKQAQAPFEGLRQAFRLALTRLARPRYRRVYTILFHRCEFIGDFNPIEDQNRIVREGFEHILKRCQQAEAEGLLNRQLSAHCAARLMHTTMFGLIYDWIRDPEQYTLDNEGFETIDALFTLLQGNRHGIGPESVELRRS